MLYMLDTNICIFLMRKKLTLTLVEKLEHLRQRNDIAISSVVLAELQYGVCNSHREHMERNQANLNLLVGEGLEVLPYTEKCAFYYGKIRADLERVGKIIGGNDLFIASHAMAENAILITNNAREFQRVDGLPVECW